MKQEDRFQVKVLFQQRLQAISAWHYNATKARRAKIYSSFTLKQMTNGLVRTSSLYYAIGRDKKTNEWVIYWSRSQKNLKTTRGGKKTKPFSFFKNDDFRYHVATLSADSSKQDIRDAIRKHHKEFNKYSFERARIHGGRFTKVISIKRALKKHFNIEMFDEVFGWANKDYALSVHQYGKKDWRLKISIPYSHLLNLPRFTEIESIRLASKSLKSFLTARRTVGQFKTPHLAMAYLDLMNSHRSQRTWRGQNPTPLSESWLTNGSTAIYSYAVDEVKSEETVTETQFELIAAIGTVLMTSAKLLGSLTGARLIMLTLLSGFGSRKGVGIFAKGKKMVQWYSPWAKGIASVDPVNGRHRANLKKNGKRYIENGNRQINAKPDLDRKKDIYIFNGKEFDLTCDDDSKIESVEKNWKERWIIAYDSKSFSGRDTEIQSNIVTDISYNGLIRLSYRCPETQKIITYAKYVKELDINPNIAIPTSIKTLLKKDNIVKITHYNEKDDFEYEASTRDKLINEVSPEIYKGMKGIIQQDKRLAEGHIKWLFRDVSKDYDAKDALEITEEDIDNSIQSMAWTGRNPDIEFLKRYYGDDWGEMHKVAKTKILGLMTFNKNAIYPNMNPVLQEAKQNAKKGWYQSLKTPEVRPAIAA